MPCSFAGICLTVLILAVEGNCAFACLLRLNKKDISLPHCLSLKSFMRSIVCVNNEQRKLYVCRKSEGQLI